MGATVDIDLVLDADLRRLLEARGMNRFRQQLGDFRTVWPDIEDDLTETSERKFGTEGATDGAARWVALKPGYAAWKARHYPGKPLMQLKGDLVASLTSRGGAAIMKATKRTLEYGTTRPYASQLDIGAPPLAGGRRAIDVTDETIDRWVEIIDKHLDSWARKALFWGD